MDVKLSRFAYSPLGTFGRLSTPDGITLYTVERPWLNNAPEISCIPEGHYICAPRMFYRGGYQAVEVVNVPNRSHILFHIANTPADVLGCIGVGARLGCINNLWAVLDSKVGFNLFMTHYGGGFNLNITQYAP